MMRQRLIKQMLGVFLLTIFTFSCSNELHVSMPEGPAGPAGKSAYELWVEGVENSAIDWPKDRTTIEQFYLYMKGRDGKDGQNGQDGLSSYELWIKEVESGVKDPHNPGKEWDKTKVEINDFWYFLTGADGKDGKNGSTPVIGDNGNWWIDGEDTGMPSRGANGQNGKDGSKIEISNNQTWIIDGTDTGVPVNGKDGAAGKDGSVVTIGENGNWYIDGIDTTVPARGVDGSNGTDGTNGKDGLSAYEVWVTEVMKGVDNPHSPGEEWDKSKISMDDFWFYLRGKAGVDGQNGKDGEDGSKIEISNNNTWIIDGTDTDIPVSGKDGKDGDKVTIGKNNNWYINDIDTGIPAKGVDGEKGETGQPGRDGSVVTIGKNGNWYIDGEDTDVPAFGKDGDNGAPGQSGSNGLSAYELWKQDVATGSLDDPKNPGQKWPTNKDTVKNFWEYLTGKDGKDGQDGNDGSGSSGNDGKDGVDGKSAYELWKEEVANGVENPHKPGTDWPKDETTINDFWEFLRGQDGKDGQDGQDGQPGEPGKPGETVPVEIGKFNVISQYVDQDHAEFVRWKDGSVTFIVYDKLGGKAAGAKVFGLPGVADQSKVYTADSNGEIIVTKDQLPKDDAKFGMTASVSYNGETEPSAPNTFVPAKIDVRLLIDNKKLPRLLLDDNLEVGFIMQRRLSTKHTWEQIPSYLGDLEQSLVATEVGAPTSIWGATKSGNISGLFNISLGRPKLLNKYKNDKKDAWDRKDHFMQFQLKSYYGESPICENKVKLAPTQYVPLLTNLKRGKILEDSKGNKYTDHISGDFDLMDLGIEYSIIYKRDYMLSGDTYMPVIEDKAIFDNVQHIGVTFKIELPDGSTYETSNDFKASIKNPGFSCNLTYIGAKVYLETNSHYFAPLWTIGYLNENSIKQNSGYMTFPDIPIVNE